MRQRVGVLGVCVWSLMHGACGGDTEKSTPATLAAKVQNAPKETELASITLSVEAEKRLGIETARVERRSVSRSRNYGGEVLIPEGKRIVISAPVAGRLEASEEFSMTAGASVKAGQICFKLFAATGDIQRAREELVQAEIRRDLARKRADRAGQLLRDKAGSQKTKEDADAEMTAAESAYAAARSRLDILQKGSVDTRNKELTPIAITAPQQGILGAIHAQAGQFVSAGAPLFEVLSLETVWIRVPVFVGELRDLEPRASAFVQIFSAEPGSPGMLAKPVAAPPAANASAASVDQFFELRNDGLALRPGQRVSVTLPLRGAEPMLTVPWASVLHDIYGGTWVYVLAGERVFTRQRVEVKFTVGHWAVLTKGPAEGTKVVTSGAAELFSTEFSTGK